MKLDRHDKDCYRIMEGDTIVGFALRMSNDKWAACDENACRLSRQQFSKPAEVRDWFTNRAAISQRKLAHRAAQRDAEEGGE